jgi:Uncharacterized protein conserved in bacteria (DUF2252)
MKQERHHHIRVSTSAFERWMASRISVVPADLRRKHERMREGPFVFLRGTFYRWVEQFPVVCPKLADAPRIMAVGDLHVENFGTWRDGEGRLIWGINDLDEAAVLPYTNDLVRLATSAVLASRDRHLDLRPREICAAILDGYAASLERGGEPVVLAERRKWLRLVAMSDLRDPRIFWDAMLTLPRARNVPQSALRALKTMCPGDWPSFTFHPRTAGVGSLGRMRFVALARVAGGYVAREAKALLPSAAARHDTGATPVAVDIARRGVRAIDPFWTITNGWIVRRLAPDCSRIEVGDLPEQRDETRLLRAMGWETANLHLATASARHAAGRHLRGQRTRWLERAADDMQASTVDDWRAWRKSG